MESTVTQQGWLVMAVPPRSDITEYLKTSFIFNLLTFKSQNSPRKTNATFGGETQALWTGEDSASWMNAFLSELRGWKPIPFT